MPSPCRVAIVGAGRMALEHCRAFRDVPGVTLAGVHSLARDKAEALASEFGIGGTFDSIDDLYSATRAALVVVAVPELSANGVSRACFRHPWTVLLEKPAGYNMKDARAIEAAAAGRKVYVALNRRFLSSTRAAVDDVAMSNGPRYIRVQDQQNLDFAAASGQPPQVVANWMYANSIHVIDYLRVFGRGRIKRVERIAPWNGGKAAVVLSAVHFDSGDIGIYEGIWNGPGPWAVAVSTPERRWEMRPLEQAAFQNANERTVQQVPADNWDLTFKPGFRRQAEAVVRAALGEPSDAVTLDQAMETMSLIEAIFE